LPHLFWDMFQLRVLPIFKVDVVAASAPRSQAVLELLQILYVAAYDECTQTVICGEVIVARLRAYQGSAIGPL
jgi:hypothetical protein